MQPIPFLDLKGQHQALRTEIDAAIAGVLERGQFILGPEVAAFEAEFARYTGAADGVAVASGTDALHLALRACDIGPGDEVITVAHTAGATVAAVVMAGARPVLVDIDPRSYTIDPEQVARHITPRTRAILPVHLYGQAVDLAPLLDLAHRHGLRVIEDCAQAHGAEYRGRRVGGWGDLGCFSFYPTKNLGALGDAGMVVTSDPALADRLRLLRQYGWRERDRAVLHGYNSRMDELQAAVLRVKLRHLDAWTARRRELAQRYRHLLGESGVALPDALPYGLHVYHLFVIRSPRRDALRQHLSEQGIGAMVHYPVPVHLQEAYRGLGLGPGALPISERSAGEILSLPLHPELADAAVERVAALVREFHTRTEG
ncbi:MAG: DegT/DnrJ/EryC1/StrS family aminotransferase [Chloroflexi bacterium]|nr:DegT/DnrJ/EryC1/StrS family aminotransferase [Chloroflexota bacterium]